MRIAECVREIAKYRLRILRAERAILAKSVPHRAAIDVLHDDGHGSIADLLDGFGADDVRMAQPGDRSRLASEPLKGVGIIKVSRADGLDRDEPSGVSPARGTPRPFCPVPARG
jgi:hypothetical protein